MSEKKFKVLAGKWQGKKFHHNAAFDGRRFSVVFEKGVGMADEKQAIVLRENWGYRVPELEQPEADGGGFGATDNQADPGAEKTGSEDENPAVSGESERLPVNGKASVSNKKSGKRA